MQEFTAYSLPTPKALFLMCQVCCLVPFQLKLSSANASPALVSWAALRQGSWVCDANGGPQQWYLSAFKSICICSVGESWKPFHSQGLPSGQLKKNTEF